MIGRFENYKWLCNLGASLPYDVHAPNWPDAIMDTGSPMHILPGNSVSYEKLEELEDEPTPELVALQIRSANLVIDTKLSPCGLFQIGGVESQARWRYVFRAELSIDGILMPDEEPFVLMNVPHPILSVGRLAKQGMRFIFDAQGFSF